MNPKQDPAPVAATETKAPAPKTKVSASEAVATLRKRMLVDGFEIVIDLEKSKGRRIVDAANGRSLLDMFSFFASMPIGYNHPRFEESEVQENLLRAARTKVANSDIYSAEFATFVETFHQVMGIPPLERYFFIDGGALAVENALKAAMDWKVRKNLAAGKGERGTEILHFRHAFHGRSGYTMSLTNTDPRKTRYFAQFDWPRVDTPHLDFNLPPEKRDAAAAEKEKEVAAGIETILSERGDDIAGIIIEPIQGEGGDNHFRGEWLRTLRAICDKYETLLIFDEVQTGMGLTGRNWCCEHFDVRPDLLAFGKKSQVCGVMAGPRLDEVDDNCFRLGSRINSTWGGNLGDMVRSTHYLRIIREEDLVGNAGRMGEHFVKGLARLAESETLVSAVRGRGLMIAFDLPDSSMRDAFWKGLFENGVLAIPCGERSIRFRPALDVEAGEIDEVLEAVQRQCRAMKKDVANAR